MKVIFRVDASVQMGIGHLMRCLTLAEALRERGVQIRFVCREHMGNLIALLQQKAMPISVLPAPAAGDTTHGEDYAVWLGVTQAEDAEQTIEALNGDKPDWLIVDHYGLNIEWEKLLRPHVGRLLVIDDLANRHHDCDVLLDQNYSVEGEQRYASFVSPWCKVLLGPKYALLKKEFRELRERLESRSHELNPNNPLARHSGEGRNPAITNIPHITSDFAGAVCQLSRMASSSTSGQDRDVAPLSREIFNHLDSGLRRNDKVLAYGLSGLKNILVFFTAGDDQGETLKAMQGIALWEKAGRVDVVVGQLNPSNAEISKKCDEFHWKYHCQVDYMPKLIAQADLVIGAGGSSNWERCALGVPALVVILAENQAPIAQALGRAGIIVNLGWNRDLQAADYANALNTLNYDCLAAMSEKALALVDAKGAERMADILLKRSSKTVTVRGELVEPLVPRR